MSHGSRLRASDGSSRSRQRPIRRRAVLVQLLEPLAEIELIPEVERRPRAPAAAASPRRRATKPRTRPAKSRARSRASAASCASSTALVDRVVRQHAVHQRRHQRRILVVVEHAAAVHRRRHRGRGVGDDRHARVERLDDRHAEALVLAGAEKEIGDVVDRRRAPRCETWPRKWTSRAPEIGDQPLQHREIELEARVRADQQQPRPRVVRRAGRRGRSG